MVYVLWNIFVLLFQLQVHQRLVQHVLPVRPLHILHHHRDLSVESVLSQSVDAPRCSVVVLPQDHHFPLVREVPRHCFRVDSFRYLLWVVQLDYTGSLVHSENRQIMVSWSILQTPRLNIKCASVMWAHQFIIKTYRILHRIGSSLIYLILKRALPTNSIQLPVIPHNQNGVVLTVMIFNLDCINLFLFYLLTSAYLNLHNFLHLFVCFICLFYLLS